MTDEQDGGVYLLSQRGDDPALLCHNVGANSWKNHLFSPPLQLSRARRSDDGALEFEEA